MTVDMKPSISSVAETIGARTDPFFQTFLDACPLGETAWANLKASIREIGVETAVRAAVIDGEAGLPIIYDGHHRLLAYAELIAEGCELPLPKIAFDSRPSRAAVVESLAKIQNGRRNANPIAFAYAILSKSDDIRQLQEQARANLKTKGQPSARAPKARIDSRKAAAAMTGLGQKAAGTILRAEKEDPELLRRIILPGTDQEHLSLRQAAHQLNKAKNDQKKSRQYRIDEARKQALAAATKVPVPDELLPGSIIESDGVLGMSRIAENSVSLIVTSTPYPILRIQYDCWTFVSYEDWLDLMSRFFAQAYRVLLRGGRIVINIDATGAQTNGGGPEGQLLHNVYADLSDVAKKARFQFYGEWCWYKQQVAGGGLYGNNWGSSGSCASPRPRRQHEYCLVWCKETAELDGDRLACDLTRKEFKNFALSHWYIRPEPRKDPEHPDFHPCPFPEELAYRFVKLLTYRNDVVLDPFAGSGTVPFVARALGRRYIGIDNSPLYIASARRRVATLDDLTPEQRVAAIKRFALFPCERSDGYPDLPPLRSGTIAPPDPMD